jgi:two-component system, response regulator PdtaR
MPPTSTTANTLRIMVVEDDALIGMLLTEMLEGMGHGVCAMACTEPEAVAAALRSKPDLMVVDARLGDGSGLSAVTQILRSGYIPHMFVTGDTAEVQTLRPDAVVIDKPFRERDLIFGIQRALVQSRINKVVLKTRVPDALSHTAATVTAGSVSV